MRCEKCNVEIVCKTRVCPLCHERLYKDLSAINQIKKMERAFPQDLVTALMRHLISIKYIW